MSILNLNAQTARCHQEAIIQLNYEGKANLSSAAVDNGSVCPNGCILLLNQEEYYCSNLEVVTPGIINNVTLIARDRINSSQQSICQTRVIVEDYRAPIAKCKDAIVSLDETGEILLLPEMINDGSMIPCSNYDLIDYIVTDINGNEPKFRSDRLGINTVTLTVINLSNGLQDDCSSNVNIFDEHLPEADCIHREVELDLSGKFVLDASTCLNPVLTKDNTEIVDKRFSTGFPTHTFSCTDINHGDGQNFVLVQVEDLYGNTTGCISKITVQDPAPVITCKNAFSIVLDEFDGKAPVYLEDVLNTKSDACDLTFEINPREFNLSHVGSTQSILLTATNKSNKKATCSTNVSVEPSCINPIGFFNSTNAPFNTNDFRAITIDDENRIWVGTSGSGLYVYDGVNWIVPFNEFGMNGFIVRSMKTNPTNGEVWVAMSKSSPCLGQVGGIYIYTDIDQYYRQLPPLSSFAGIIDETSTLQQLNAYLISIGFGLTLPNGSNYWDFLGLYNSKLQSLAVRSMDYNSVSNNMWAGCTPQVCQPGYNGGLSYLKNDGTFQVIRSGMPPYQNQDRMITAITSSKTDGTVFAGIGRSCNTSCIAPYVINYTKDGNLIGTRYNAATTGGQLPLTENSSSLAIRALLIDNNNNLWVGGEFGISVRTTVGGSEVWKLLTSGTTHLEDGAMVNFDAITQSNDGTIYIGTSMGLVKFKGQVGNFAEITNPAKWNLLCFGDKTNHNVTSIKIARDKNIWVATRNGLFKLPSPGGIVKSVSIDASNTRFFKKPLSGVTVQIIDEADNSLIDEVTSDQNGKFQEEVDLKIFEHEDITQLNSIYKLRFTCNYLRHGVSTHEHMQIEISNYEPEKAIDEIVFPFPIVQKIYEQIHLIKSNKTSVDLNIYKSIISLNLQSEIYQFADLDYSLFQLFHEPIENSKINNEIERLGSTYLSLYATLELSKQAYKLIERLPEPIMNLVNMIMDEIKVNDKLAKFLKEKSGINETARSISESLGVDIVANALNEHAGVGFLLEEGESTLISALDKIESTFGNSYFGNLFRNKFENFISSLSESIFASRQNFKNAIAESLVERAQIDDGATAAVEFIKTKVGEGLVIILLDLYTELSQKSIDKIIKYPQPFSATPGNFSTVAAGVVGIVNVLEVENQNKLNLFQLLQEFNAELALCKDLQKNWVDFNAKNLALGSALKFLKKYPVAGKIVQTTEYATKIAALAIISEATSNTLNSQLNSTNIAFNLPLEYLRRADKHPNSRSITSRSKTSDLSNLTQHLDKSNLHLDSIKQAINLNRPDSILNLYKRMIRLDSLINSDIALKIKDIQAVADSALISNADFVTTYGQTLGIIHTREFNNRALFMHIISLLYNSTETELTSDALELIHKIQAANSQITDILQTINNQIDNIHLSSKMMITRIEGKKSTLIGEPINLTVYFKNYGFEEATDVNLKIKSTKGFLASPDSIFLDDIQGLDTGHVNITIETPTNKSFAVLPFRIEDKNGIGNFDQHTISTIKVCTTRYFKDNDVDGFGNPNISILSCEIPQGYVDNNMDCNDNDNESNPKALEICNNYDDNCNGIVDENLLKIYFRDFDGDGFGDPRSQISTCTLPAGFVTNNSDCNDSEFSTNPAAIEICNLKDDNCDGRIDENCGNNIFYRDNDNDGYGDILNSISTINQQPPPGFVINNQDCNDNQPFTNPAANELCDGFDNNCNGLTDEGHNRQLYYKDFDLDGFGNSEEQLLSCISPNGYVENSLDCNDQNALIYPGAIELCNGIDDNCNGTIDETLAQIKYYRDADHDGFGDPNIFLLACSVPTGFVTNNSDCNDSNSNIHPGAIEQCNEADDNCNGAIDEGVTITFYRDADNDGFGTSTITTQACTAPLGYVSNNTDCNDNNASIHPGSNETCNGFDDNCNGTIDEGVTITFFRDVDNDGFGTSTISVQACVQPLGYVLNNTDCNDNNASVYPNASETCDGLDNDCNGTIDENVKLRYYRDVDGDGFGNPNRSLLACIAPTGYVANNTDCNDGRKLSNPNAPELCNGIDDNCNGLIDENAKTLFYRDADGDGYGNPNATSLSCFAPAGYVANNTDCNDNVSSIYPGADEICNDVDDDCDGQIDEGCPAVFTFYNDLDADGFGNPVSFIIRNDQIPPFGFVSNNSDCDDNNANIHPQAFEICNDIDDNCSGDTDEGLSPLHPSAITGHFLNVCKNSTKIYSVINQPGVVFNWTAPANSSIISGQGTNTVTVNFSSSFVSGTLSVTATKCTTSGARKLTIYSLPAAPAQIVGLNTACINSIHNYSCSIIPDAISYNWIAPAGSSIISGQGSSEVTLQFGGSVSTGNISVQSVNACGNSITHSYQLNVVNCNNSESQNRSDTGINQYPDNELNVWVYPNPTNNNFSIIIINNNLENIQIRVFDILGKRVLNEIRTSGEGIQIGAELKAGTYFAEIIQSGLSKTIKLIKL